MSDNTQSPRDPTVADVDGPTLAKFESLGDDQRRELYDTNREVWLACTRAVGLRNEGRLRRGPLGTGT